MDDTMSIPSKYMFDDNYDSMIFIWVILSFLEYTSIIFDFLIITLLSYTLYYASQPLLGF